MKSVPTPPSRSLDQRMSSLQIANAIRTQRAEDKKRVKQGQLDARDILFDPPQYWESAHIADLLRSLPGVGTTKAEKMLKRELISPSKTLYGMTEEQRKRLETAIRPYCPHRLTDSE